MEQSTPLLDRTQAPAIGDFGLMSLSDVETLKLPSGIEVIALNDNNFEDVCRISALMLGGAAEADDSSLPSLAVTQLREGTDTLCGADIADRLESAGAWLKAGASAHHRAASLYALTSQLDRVLPVFLDTIAHPSFPDAEFGKAATRASANRKLAMERNSFLAGREIERLCYGEGHPLTGRTSPASILSLSSADARTFHQRWLKPEALKFFISGRFDSATFDRTLTAIDNIGADLRGPAPDLAVVAAPRIVGSVESRLNGVARNQAAIQIAVPVIGAEHPDYNKLLFTVKTLGGYFGSRLMTNIREEKGYTYGISASVLRQPEGTFMMISTECDRSYVDSVMTEIDREINGLATRKVDDDELERMRRHARSVKASVLENIFTQMGYRMSCAMSLASPDQFVEQQEALNALTAADISRMAELYLTGAPRITAIANG